MNRRHAAVLAAALILSSALPASAQGFFDNFLKPEYLVPVSEFPATSGGDLLLTYYQVPITAVPNGELLVIGEFPRARYFSITAYDDHGAVIGKLDDYEIQPYVSSGNPWHVGGPAGAEDILYAVTVRIGTPGAPAPASQCQTPVSVHENVLDATVRHTATSFYSSAQSGYTTFVPSFGTITHEDAPTTSGMFLLIRSYMRASPLGSSAVDLRKPLVWVRAASTGCPARLAPAGESLPASSWFTLSSVLHLDQAYGHVQHELDLGLTAPYGQDPRGDVGWTGREEYTAGGAVGRYLSTLAPLDPSLLNSQGRVMRLQFRKPAMPCAPNPCSLTGSEQLRYWSITFEDSIGRSLGTLSDASLLPNAEGYVTLVVSFGSTLPAHVTSANGYTVLTASLPSASRLVMRNYLPAPTFGCSTQSVPPRTSEYHVNGGYMGEYTPVITFPLASSLPATAQAVNMNEPCGEP
jgi:hypothetical protein